MSSHITLGSNDLARSRVFYHAVMPVLGHRLLFELAQGLLLWRADGPKVFNVSLFNGKEVRPGNGGHAAFKVERRAQVDSFQAASLAHGGSDEGKPGLRPHHHPNYYVAYIATQAVCHRKDG